MVENVKEFSAELNRLALRKAEILQSRKVPLLVAGTLCDVASSVAELSELGVGIEPLEAAGADPAIGCSSARSVVGACALCEVADPVRPIAGKPAALQ